MKKITLVVENDVYDALEALRKKSGKRTVEDVFCEAVKCYEWVIEELQKGNIIVSQAKDDKHDDDID